LIAVAAMTETIAHALPYQTANRYVARTGLIYQQKNGARGGVQVTGTLKIYLLTRRHLLKTPMSVKLRVSQNQTVAVNPAPIVRRRAVTADLRMGLF
jgi:hypothetical protein